jgi:hypothetical protein
MLSSKSMAVWCLQPLRARRTSFEVHFNYWRLGTGVANSRHSDNGICDFAEIGVRLDDAKSIDQILIYVPLAITAASVRDCAPYFREANISQGIFNEVITVKPPSPNEMRTVVLREKNNKLFCRVHCFKTGSHGVSLDVSELTVARFAEGSLITIRSAALAVARAQGRNAKHKPVYFRLRVLMPTHPGSNPFVKEIKAADRVLQSGFEQIEYLDFRLNEARTLPPQVESRMRNEHALGARLKLVAFLTAIPVESDLSEANSLSHKMRLLEYPIWKDYAPGVLESMVVYHWKRAETLKHIGDFNAFVKLRIRQSNRWIMIKYLGVAFAFGVAGNLTASALESCIPKIAKWVTNLCA